MDRWTRMTAACLLALASAGPTTAPPAPTTRPAVTVAVPYKLTPTNHIMVRAKLNGKGPYNFILDTGCPTLVINKELGDSLGIQAPVKGWSTLNTLDVEGGVHLDKVKCIVETPYQLQGMNAIGVTGDPIDGLMGYTVVRQFRMEIDLTRDKLNWTPVPDDNKPPKRHGDSGQKDDQREADEKTLEATGSLVKMLGPLIKPVPKPPQPPQGLIGVTLVDGDGTVSIGRVFADSPADKSGLRKLDQITEIDAVAVHGIEQVRDATAKLHAGQVLTITIERDHHPIHLAVTAGQGI